jgi:AbrB family looped-hinge helix DNA binding protein
MPTESITFTTKGQVVIPAAIRRMFGIEEGTKGAVTVTEDGILIRPITKAYISGLRGSLKHLPLMEKLAEDRAREREL